METNINIDPLQLLLIGMSTVFVILGIVMGIGKFLIAVVNKYSPEVPKRKGIASSRASTKAEIPDEHVAILASVVDLISQNKGMIKKIEKIS